MNQLIYLFSLIAIAIVSAAQTVSANEAPGIEKTCFDSLKALPGKANDENLKKACTKIAVLDGCKSVKGEQIFHFEHASAFKDAKKILAISLIHGDEKPAGSVSRSWMERLSTIDPRNSWRIIPILNPDGLAKNTRTNANGVDINRNFPTKNWDKEAPNYWEKKMKKDPRRFPGKVAASEPETLCMMKHIEEFNPDFIISLHTPYGVLDFDGPAIPFPKFQYLPWQSLGNYPGSLGRYMWADRKHPVLTVELKDKGVIEQLEVFNRLQDITGDVAIKSEKILKKNEKK